LSLPDVPAVLDGGAAYEKKTWPRMATLVQGGQGPPGGTSPLLARPEATHDAALSAAVLAGCGSRGPRVRRLVQRTHVPSAGVSAVRRARRVPPSSRVRRAAPPRVRQLVQGRADVRPSGLPRLYNSRRLSCAAVASRPATAATPSTTPTTAAKPAWPASLSNTTSVPTTPAAAPTQAVHERCT
jgi:hypothetical protein